jgi:hypothetical protein
MARDAMPAGGRLQIAASNVEVVELPGGVGAPIAAGSYVLVAVTDTGCGMDAATLARQPHRRGAVVHREAVLAGVAGPQGARGARRAGALTGSTARAGRVTLRR